MDFIFKSFVIITGLIGLTIYGTLYLIDNVLTFIP